MGSAERYLRNYMPVNMPVMSQLPDVSFHEFFVKTVDKPLKTVDKWVYLWRNIKNSPRSAGLVQNGTPHLWGVFFYAPNIFPEQKSVRSGG
jgi:hypothetical protein